MGHEAMGYVAEVGEGITALNVGDYVVVPDRVASGHLDMFPPGDHSFGAGEELGGLQGLHTYTHTHTHTHTLSLSLSLSLSDIYKDMVVDCVCGMTS